MERVRLIQSHSNNLLLVHIAWSTQDREPLLGPEADAWLDRFLRQAATGAGCAVLACGNAADHVHVLVRFPATLSIADGVHRLKGAPRYAWNVGRPARGRLRWQTGYWAESVSRTHATPLSRYIEKQREHHAAQAAPESWELPR